MQYRSCWRPYPRVDNNRNSAVTSVMMPMRKLSELERRDVEPNEQKKKIPLQGLNKVSSQPTQNMPHQQVNISTIKLILV